MVNYFDTIRKKISNILKDSLRVLVFQLKIAYFITFEKDNLKFKLYPSSMLFRLWVDRNSYDRDLSFYKLFLKPGDIFIDVGANIGLMSLTAAQIVGNEGEVIAIEAFPTTFKYLSKLVQLNKFSNIKQYNFAIGEKEGEVYFNKFRDDSHNQISGFGNVTVPLRKLENIIDSPKKINLLKIDVEGYELFVLKGASNLLYGVDHIYFESSKKMYSNFGYTFKEIHEFLSANNFKIYRFVNETTVAQVSINYESLKTENLFATKDFKNFSDRTGISELVVEPS